MPTLTGVIALESKKAMRERGVSSPDFADPLAMDQAPKGADESLADLKAFFAAAASGGKK